MRRPSAWWRLLAALTVGTALSLTLTTCTTNKYDDVHLTIATGSTVGVYYKLGNALADAWSEQLDIERPTVMSTKGSLRNLVLLRQGTAQVALSQADAAADATARNPSLCALARIHDDYLHVVVRTSSQAQKLADLRSQRVSIGEEESGTRLIAKRLLTAAGLDPTRDLRLVEKNLDDSIAALRNNEIDAFFWSGGLPTDGVAELAGTVTIRLLDLGDVLEEVRSRYPTVYDQRTVPASAYGTGRQFTTLVVRNFLLVDASMKDDVAEALVRGLFDARKQLASANPAARTIDPRSAIYTSPLPLHPGAERYYRED